MWNSFSNDVVDFYGSANGQVADNAIAAAEFLKDDFLIGARMDRPNNLVSDWIQDGLVECREFML